MRARRTFPIGKIPPLNPGGLLIALVAVLMTTFGATPVEAAESLPSLTGAEFRDFYNRLEPYKGMVRLATPPSITGNVKADEHIQSLARGRGYRLRSQHSGSLVYASGVPLDPQAARALNGLIGKASQSGFTLSAGFGYRSVDLQRQLFLRRISGYSASAIVAGSADGAINAALMWVAPPGYSKHHGGFTVDLRAAGGAAFGSSGVGRWLAANNYSIAKSFGFMPNYPSGAGLQGPEPEPWEYAYVGVPELSCSLFLARLNSRSAFDDCVAGYSIETKYQALGGRSGFLGAVVQAERAAADGRGRWAKYAGGNIYWTQQTRAHEVHGAILTEYHRVNNVRGPLGYPTSDTRTTIDLKRRYENFEKGRIYYRSETATYALPNPFFVKHESLGSAWGPLGYPTSSVRSSTDGRSTYVIFDEGRIYSRGAAVVEIHGVVLDRHESLQGARGPLGYPTSDLSANPDGRGKSQWFEHGLVWYRPTIGAFAQWGAVLDRYAANGNSGGYLRYPTSNPMGVGDGRGTFATYERGRIYATPASGSHQVHGALLTAWLDTYGGPTGSLGYPTSELDPSGTTGGRFQTFEGGRLQLTAAGTVVPA